MHSCRLRYVLYPSRKAIGTFNDSSILICKVEVVKCRAQVESQASPKLGSFGIAKLIARQEGLKGDYLPAFH